jgi:hypothetical protein
VRDAAHAWSSPRGYARSVGVPRGRSSDPADVRRCDRYRRRARTPRRQSPLAKDGPGGLGRRISVARACRRSHKHPLKPLIFVAVRLQERFGSRMARHRIGKSAFEEVVDSSYGQRPVADRRGDPLSGPASPVAHREHSRQAGPGDSGAQLVELMIRSPRRGSKFLPCLVRPRGVSNSLPGCPRQTSRISSATSSRSSARCAWRSTSC